MTCRQFQHFCNDFKLAFADGDVTRVVTEDSSLNPKIRVSLVCFLRRLVWAFIWNVWAVFTVQTGFAGKIYVSFRGWGLLQSCMVKMTGNGNSWAMIRLSHIVGGLFSAKKQSLLMCELYRM